MCLSITRRNPGRYRAQQGAALITILFAIIVLGFLGLVANRNQEKASAQLVSSVLGTRADMAARSAMQIDISDFYMDSAGSCRNGDIDASDPDARIIDINFTGNGLNQCAATVRCTPLGKLDSGAKVYKLESTGTCKAGQMVYQRVVEVGIRE